MISIAVIAGPTASGKTECAHEVASRLPAELITCDSMQVYRGMELLSQAPTTQERERYPYHLTAFLDPSEAFHAAAFASECRRIAGEIHSRGRLPVIVCGTGFYLTAFAQGVAAGPGESPQVRDALRERARIQGNEALYLELRDKDPAAAQILHPNDSRRVIRALELIEVTGQLCSELKAQRQAPGRDCRIQVWGLKWEREALYRRINDRVDRMMREGLEEEVRRLTARTELSKTAKSCLGVPEMEALLAGHMSREDAVAALKQNTRRFAKRQITWFRHHEPVRWIPTAPGAAFESAKQTLVQEIRHGWKTP